MNFGQQGGWFWRAALIVCAWILAGGAGARSALPGDSGSALPRGSLVTPDEAIRLGLQPREALIAGLSQPSWFPDSRRFVFSRFDPAKRTTWIYRVALAGSISAPLGEGASPVVSPDGRSIAFLKGMGPDRQIWIMSADGSSPRVLTHVPSGLQGSFVSVAWSPDSASLALAYTAGLFEPRGKPAAGGSTVVVYGSVEDTPAPSEIWVYGVSGGTPRRIASIEGSLACLRWSPRGDTLLAYQFRLGSAFRDSGDLSRLLSVSTRTGEIQVVASGGGETMYGAYAPDGRQVAFYYDADSVRYPDMYTVALAAPGAAIRPLTPKLLAQRFAPPSWSADGKYIYYSTKAGAFSQVFRVDLQGRIEQITRSSVEHGAVTVAPDGRKLLWEEEAASGQRRLIVVNTKGARILTRFDLTPDLNSFRFGEAREVRWQSADGLELAGFIVLPPDPAPGQPHPLLVDIHGGPIGGISMGGSIITALGALERQMWAAKGYIVFAPDYRSDGVAGWEPIERARLAQDFMMKDFEDILSGVDDLIGSGLVDPERMAVGGHSYGALLTNWIITHTQRFKAAVSYEGGGDWYREYGSEFSVGGNSTLAWQFLGRPWEVPENYLRASSLFLMKSVTTPTLFIVGGGTRYGSNEPTQYEFMYTALKQRKLDTQMLRYEGESHAVLGPANVADLTRRVIAWVDDHLQSPGTR